MTSWDDEEEDLMAKDLKNAWDDDETVVPDAWDAETNEVQVKPVSTKPKLPLAERVRLKEEKKKKEREEKMRREEEYRAAQPLSELQREKLAEESEIVDVETLKSINTSINALIFEKQKLNKSKTKKKSKKLVVERDNDYDMGEDIMIDEYDDFM